MKQKKKRQPKPPSGMNRTARGPAPERLKITGVKNWEEAVDIAMQKKRPPGGWTK